MQEEKKQVRLILSDAVVELSGTPEELARQIADYKLIDVALSGSTAMDSPDWGTIINDSDGVVIPFPQRGRFAHPSNGGGHVG